jgi:hypothetical protein
MRVDSKAVRATKKTWASAHHRLCHRVRACTHTQIVKLDARVEDLWDLPRKLGHAHHKVHSSAAAQGDGDTRKVREAVLKWLK